MTLADPTQSAPSPTRLLEKHSPVTGARLGEFPIAESEAVDAAVARARTAFQGWRETPLEVRLEALNRGREVLAEHAERYARRIAEDTGKPVFEALMFELAVIPMFLDHYLKRVLKLLARRRVSTPLALTGKAGYIEHFPRGVIGVIAPWNVPFQLAVIPVISALISGNTAVLKPSEHTPHTGANYHALLAELLPAGVLGLAQGTGSVGAALVDSAVDMVAFTGSIATGQAIRRAAAAALKRLVLELGGKDPMIVLPGADLEAAARHAAIEATRNSGQVCVAVERILVHQDIAETFSQRVAEIVRGLQVGDPRDEATQIGPMANARQRDLVLGQLARARAGGARFLVEGEARGPGFYLSPSVVVGVTPEMDLAREETFGPVVAIQVVRDADEAVARANDTVYGLGASVWGPAGAETEAIADKLQAGMVGVNRGLSTAGGAPWVGWKMSGFGYTRSAAGMRQFMQPQSRAVRA